MIRLTRREEECLGFIAAYTDREGRPPQQDEIAEHLGASSRGFVFRLVSPRCRRERNRGERKKARARVQPRITGLRK